MAVNALGVLQIGIKNFGGKVQKPVAGCEEVGRLEFEDARQKRAFLMSGDRASALHKKSGLMTFDKGEVLEVKSLQTRLLRVIKNLGQYYEK